MTDLNLTSNPRGEWCFQRLKDRLAWKPGPDSTTLKMIQNPLMYHSVLGVKRSGVEMSTAARQREVANTYRNFVTRHALAWLAEEGGITVPAWLTPEMLGKTTLSDTTNGYFTNGSKLISRYEEAGRTCRRDMVTWTEKNAPQQQLRSGTQAADLMNGLNNKMFSESSEGKKRAAEALAKQALDGDGAAAGGAEQSIPETAATDPVQTARSSAGHEGEAPGHWMHVNLLTFALFGPQSDQSDSDLCLSSSDGPTRKRSTKAESPEAVESPSGSASPDASIDSSDCIKLLAPEKTHHSRRDLKKTKHATVKIEADSGSKQKVVDIIQRQDERLETGEADMALTLREWRESMKRKRLADKDKDKQKKHKRTVKAIRKGNRDKLAAHDRQIKILEARLKLAKTNGDDEGRDEAYKKLKEVLSAEVELEDVPGPLPEEDETVLSASAAVTTGATPAPTSMAGRPLPIGTASAPNAQVPERTNEMAIATRSWEGMAGSAVPGQSSPSMGRGQLPPGWAPSPAPADPASVEVATTSRGGMAGSAVPGQSSPSMGRGQLPPGWAPSPAPADPASVEVATTSRGGMAGSAVPGQSSPSMGRGQLPPGWAPSPAPADPASVEVATTSRGGMAGSAVPARDQPARGGSQLPPGWAPSPAPAAPVSFLADSTSREGMAGSAVPGQSSPSMGRGQLPPGWAPSPAPADPASVKVATTSRGGMAGSAVPAQHQPARGGSQLPPGWAPSPAPAAPVSVMADSTSREGVAGSTVPGQSTPSMGRGQLPPGWAPSPAPADPASVKVATISRGGMAGSAVPAQHQPARGGNGLPPGWSPTPALAARGSATAVTHVLPERSGSLASLSGLAPNMGRGQPAPYGVQTVGPPLPGFPGASRAL